jgi:hypothetical protein
MNTTSRLLVVLIPCADNYFYLLLVRSRHVHIARDVAQSNIRILSGSIGYNTIQLPLCRIFSTKNLSSNIMLRSVLSYTRQLIP